VGERLSDGMTKERVGRDYKKVYPGLFVSGMAANAVFGFMRMGSISGGVFRSTQRTAELISRCQRDLSL